MSSVIIVVHVIACFALILIVLLQTGKGQDMGAAFGGASQTLFGSAGPATFLNKLTTAAAIIFMLTSLGLAYFATSMGSSSLMKNIPSKPGVEEKLPEVPKIPTGENK